MVTCRLLLEAVREEEEEGQRRGVVSESHDTSHGLYAWVNNVECRLMHQQRLIVTLSEEIAHCSYIVTLRDPRI